MFKILNFAILATFLGIGLLHAEDNNTSKEMIETTEPYWALSLNQEILNSQIGVESYLPDQAIFWGLSLDSDNLDETGWQSLIEAASSKVENSTSFITAVSQSSKGSMAEYWAVSPGVENLTSLMAAVSQANDYPMIRPIPPELLKAINSLPEYRIISLHEKRQKCVTNGRSWNDCFSENTNIQSGNEIVNPYSDIIKLLSVPDQVGIISAGESIRNGLASRH